MIIEWYDVENINFEDGKSVGCLGVLKPKSWDVYINSNVGQIAINILNTSKPYYLIDNQYVSMYVYNSNLDKQIKSFRKKLINYIKSLQIYYKNIPDNKRYISKNDLIYLKYFNYKKYNDLDVSIINDKNFILKVEF